MVHCRLCSINANTWGNAVNAFTLGPGSAPRAGSNLVRGGIALRLQPVVSIRNLAGVGRRGQDLRHQRVWIERDWGHELLQLCRIERLGLSWRLAITLLRIGPTRIRVRG